MVERYLGKVKVSSSTLEWGFELNTMVDRKVVEEIIEKYKDAWEKQDPDAILEIFTEDAIYHERVLEKPFIGHSEIRRYWKEKVVEGQEDIHFNLLALYIDGDTAIVEWEVNFFDKKEGVKKHMKEIAILEIKNNKIASFREYWTSKQI